MDEIPVKKQKATIMSSVYFNIGCVLTAAIVSVSANFALFNKSYKVPPNCQSICWNVTGIPVTANGDAFKLAIRDYLNNPSLSPHGSNINCWNVSQVTNMSRAFSSAAGDDPLFQSFDQPLNCWDVSSVIDMSFMFNWVGQLTSTSPLDLGMSPV
jgi:hypothetical protein